MIDFSGPQPAPHIFYLPPGVNFAQCLVEGLRLRIGAAGPELLARTTILTNTRRSARAIEAVFGQGPATLLPRILVIEDLATANLDPAADDLPAAVPALRIKLKLARLIRKTAGSGGDPVPAILSYDLAESLKALLAEAKSEAVDLGALSGIFEGEFSAHRLSSMTFLRALLGESMAVMEQSSEWRLRQSVDRLVEHWNRRPPVWPVIVAGSTGSRGPTATLMKAVVNLEQGAVILPGLDTETPTDIWHQLREDHPQYRFAVLARPESVGFDPADLRPWHKVEPPVPARNCILSMALRPAPTTDTWITSGSSLRPLVAEATSAISLIEAPDAQAESTAIGLALRGAVAQGKSCALVTPDRNLARRVGASLARWKITPDDSAGTPLSLTPPGILLRLTAQMLEGDTKPAHLLSILKHPLCGGAGEARTTHNKLASRLEQYFLRGGPPVIDSDSLTKWLRDQESPNAIVQTWIGWLARALVRTEMTETTLADWVTEHIWLTEFLSRGSADEVASVWDKQAGEAAKAVLNRLASESEYAGAVTARSYGALLDAELFAIEIREEAFVPDEGIAIWGTLEARIQSADVIILGGLNEGVWPGPVAADAWLNRATRQGLGLPLPERKTGLSAHDFQQAAAAKEIIFSRALRDGESPTIQSRWLARFTNLLGGLDAEGTRALADMRGRGSALLALAEALDRPGGKFSQMRAKRPSPCPPVTSRPTALSVTQVETLVRNPYEIYARKILQLKELDPIGRQASIKERGSALHAVMEAFVRDQPGGDAGDLVTTAQRILDRDVPWPEIRRLWLAQLRRSAERIIIDLAERREYGTPLLFEQHGSILLQRPNGRFSLAAKADRIDLAGDGSAVIYDYKAGGVPSAADIKNFSKQLLLEAAIVQNGGFAQLGPRTVSRLEYLTLGATGKNMLVETASIESTWAEFLQLLASYEQPDRPYPARIRPDYIRFASGYDHLSRKGEWADGEALAAETVK